MTQELKKFNFFNDERKEERFSEIEQSLLKLNQLALIQTPQDAKRRSSSMIQEFKVQDNNEEQLNLEDYINILTQKYSKFAEMWEMQEQSLKQTLEENKQLKEKLALEIKEHTIIVEETQEQIQQIQQRNFQEYESVLNQNINSQLLQAEVQATQQQIQQLGIIESNIKAMCQESEQNLKIIEEIQQNNYQLEQEYKTLFEEENQLSLQLKFAQDDYLELESKIPEVKKQITQLKKENQKYEQQINGLQQEQFSMKESSSRTIQEQKTVEKKSSNLSTKLEELYDLKAKLEQEVELKNNQLQAMRVNNSQFEQRIQELLSVDQQLVQEKELTVHLKIEQEILKEQIEVLLQSDQQQCKKLNISYLETSKSKLFSPRKRKSQQNSPQNEEIELLKKDIEEKSQVISKQEENMHQLDEKIEKLQLEAQIEEEVPQNYDANKFYQQQENRKEVKEKSPDKKLRYYKLQGQKFSDSAFSKNKNKEEDFQSLLKQSPILLANQI